MQPWKNRLRRSGNECGEDQLDRCDGPLAPWMRVLGTIGSPPLATLYRSHRDYSLLIAVDHVEERQESEWGYTWAHELERSRIPVGFAQISAGRRCVPDSHPASYLDLRSIYRNSNTVYTVQVLPEARASTDGQIYRQCGPWTVLAPRWFEHVSISIVPPFDGRSEVI